MRSSSSIRVGIKINEQGLTTRYLLKLSSFTPLTARLESHFLYLLIGEVESLYLAWRNFVQHKLPFPFFFRSTVPIYRFGSYIPFTAINQISTQCSNRVLEFSRSIWHYATDHAKQHFQKVRPEHIFNRESPTNLALIP